MGGVNPLIAVILSENISFLGISITDKLVNCVKMTTLESLLSNLIYTSYISSQRTCFDPALLLIQLPSNFAYSLPTCHSQPR